MYKFKIINYKPYEYELLQAQLDTLGQQGYTTDDLSLISIFKKLNHPVYYKIDFFKQTGKTRIEKSALKERFLDPYIDAGYEPIYNKNRMYVFVGEKEFNKPIKWKEKENIIDDKKIFKNLFLAVFTLFLSGLFLIASLSSMHIDTFLSYGMTFIYVGVIVLCIAIVYRNFSNLHHTNMLKKKLSSTDVHFHLKSLQKLRKIYLILFTIACIFIGGGLIEDLVNSKDIDFNKHPIISLHDIGIEGSTKKEAYSKSSFTIPHLYNYLETLDDDTVFYVKEYELNSKESATQLFNNFLDHPNEILCDTVENSQNIIYGYNNKNLSAIVIHKENNVVLISFTWDITEQQIKKIIDYYQ